MVDTYNAVLHQVVPNQTGIVDVWCTADGNTYSRGTGTRIKTSDPSTIKVLTAAHVPDGSTTCLLLAPDRTKLGTSTTWRQPMAGRDLTVIEGITWTAAASGLPALSVVQSYQATLGELVLLVSYPGKLDHDLQYTFGFVTDANLSTSSVDAAWVGAVAADFGAYHGSSGAPVFNAKGELVGELVGLPDGDVGDIKAWLPIWGTL